MTFIKNIAAITSAALALHHCRIEKYQTYRPIPGLRLPTTDTIVHGRLNPIWAHRKEHSTLSPDAGVLDEPRVDDEGEDGEVVDGGAAHLAEMTLLLGQSLRQT